jgi:hypothetical protein
MGKGIGKHYIFCVCGPLQDFEYVVALVFILLCSSVHFTLLQFCHCVTHVTCIADHLNWCVLNKVDEECT